MQSRLSRRDVLTLGGRSDSMSNVVHIASLVIQLRPDAAGRLRSAVAKLPAAELEQTPHPGKWVLVLESSEPAEIGRAADTLSQLPGVLTVSIVAHLTETAQALEQESADESTTVSQA